MSIELSVLLAKIQSPQTNSRAHFLLTCTRMHTMSILVSRIQGSVQKGSNELLNRPRAKYTKSWKSSYPFFQCKTWWEQWKCQLSSLRDKGVQSTNRLLVSLMMRCSRLDHRSQPLWVSPSRWRPWIWQDKDLWAKIKSSALKQWLKERNLPQQLSRRRSYLRMT